MLLVFFCSPGLNLIKNLPYSVNLYCIKHHRHLYCRHTECDIEPRHHSHNTSLTEHVKCILTGAQTANCEEVILFLSVFARKAVCRLC